MGNSGQLKMFRFLDEMAKRQQMFLLAKAI